MQHGRSISAARRLWTLGPAWLASHIRSGKALVLDNVARALCLSLFLFLSRCLPEGPAADIHSHTLLQDIFPVRLWRRPHKAGWKTTFMACLFFNSNNKATSSHPPPHSLFLFSTKALPSDPSCRMKRADNPGLGAIRPPPPFPSLHLHLPWPVQSVPTSQLELHAAFGLGPAPVHLGTVAALRVTAHGRPCRVWVGERGVSCQPLAVRPGRSLPRQEAAPCHRAPSAEGCCQISFPPCTALELIQVSGQPSSSTSSSP